jgi:glycosyltransferase 2 family protein
VQARMKPRLRPGHWLAAMVLATVLYTAFAAFSGLSQFIQILDGLPGPMFLLALGLSSLNYLLRFLKWQYYLKHLGVRAVPWDDSLLIFLSGFVFTVTPAKVGEVFKSAVLERTHGVPLPLTAPVVVVERLTDVIAVVLLVLAGSLSFPGALVWALFGALAVAFGLLVIGSEAAGRMLLRPFEHWTRGRQLLHTLTCVQASLRQLSSPRLLLWPTLLSVIGWGLEGVGLFALLRGLGTAVPVSYCVFFHATATLAGALVPLPGGLGVTEGVIQQQLVRVAQVAAPTATVAMLLIRLATLWWAVVVGLLAFGCLRLRFPGLKQLGTTAPSSAPSAPPLS